MRVKLSETKKPWEMSQKEFNAFYKKGKIHHAKPYRDANDEEVKKRRESGEYVSPLLMGELFGYSPEDIAHFYVVRTGGDLNNKLSNKEDRRRGEIIGRWEYIRDAVLAERDVPESVLEDF
jgi:hypothetical protein